MFDRITSHATSMTSKGVNKMLDLLTTDSQVDRTLLLIDDDEVFVKRLARAMEKRGFLNRPLFTGG
jgi:hypothetical protein